MGTESPNTAQVIDSFQRLSISWVLYRDSRFERDGLGLGSDQGASNGDKVPAQPARAAAPLPAGTDSEIDWGRR